MKLLILLPRIPYPLQKGDKLRAFHQIRVLSEKHRITLVAVGYPGEINENARQNLEQYCETIHFFRLPVFSRYLHTFWFFIQGRPLQTGYFYSFNAAGLIRRLARQKQIEHVYCQLFRTAEMVKKTSVKKTIDYQDAFSASMKKRIKAAGSLKKLLLKIEYQRIRRYEKKIYSWCDHHTVISDIDRDHLDLPGLKIVRNGVDTDYFQPQKQKESSFELIFTGNMSYLPNVHTALYLAKEVMPKIWQNIPDARLMLAGANPSYRVQQLAGEYIKVTGWIDDIRDAYNDARIFIAPIQIGTGLQNKVLEAMAMELPCITSSAALTPINATPDQEIRVAENADEYARLAIELLNDKEQRITLGRNARDFVIKEFDWKACTAELERLVSSRQ